MSSSGAYAILGRERPPRSPVGLSGRVGRTLSVVVVAGFLLMAAVGAVSASGSPRSGSVFTWGDNADGQLGNGLTVNSSTPVQVSGISTATNVAAGSGHSLAVLSDGTVRAWGWGASGQLGTGATANSSVPVQVLGISTLPRSRPATITASRCCRTGQSRPGAQTPVGS